MASTPVKTSLVERFRTGLTGTPVSADTTALKGKSAPERVRQFESLLEQTNKAAPAQKPAAPRNSAAPDTSASKDTSSASRKSSDKTAQADKNPKSAEPEESDAADAPASESANIADSAVLPVDQATPVVEEAAPVAAADAPTPDGESDSEALLAAVLPLPVTALIPQTITGEPVADVLPPAADASLPAALPVDADLAQQEPVSLPQPVIAETPTPQDETILPLAAALAAETPADADTASPLPAPEAKPGTPAALPAAPSAPQQTAGSAPASAPQADAVIESLTVVAADATPEAAKTETGTAPQTTAVEPTPDAVAAQTATVAPLVSENQPKAKSAPQKPAAETATGTTDDGLAALPTAEAVPVAENETARDQSGNRDQSHGDKARERGQDRAQAGERLAAKLADSQASLIRDEAALSGPVQTFKAVLKTAADASAAAPSATTPDQSSKSATANQPVSAAIAANTSAAGPQTAAAAKSAARAAPVFHTPVVQQVGTRLVETAENGGGRVVMDLRPEHLGRVTIDVDVRDDGRVTATILVDNPEALDQLRRDGSQLEQALRDSGLNPDQNSLNFGLREQAQDQGGFGRDGRKWRGDAALTEAEAEPQAAPAPTQQSVVPGLGVIDIRI